MVEKYLRHKPDKGGIAVLDLASSQVWRDVWGIPPLLFELPGIIVWIGDPRSDERSIRLEIMIKGCDSGPAKGPLQGTGSFVNALAIRPALSGTA